MVLCLLCATACGDTNYTANNTTYVIGATGPLTGDASVYGVAVQRGASLAIDEINAAGGLNGVLFSFEMVDDMATADKAATGYTSLFEKGIDKILKKVGEECTEVIIAGKGGDRAEAIFEIADLTYHIMVMMTEMGILIDEVRAELASRHVVDKKIKQEKMK